MSRDGLGAPHSADGLGVDLEETEARWQAGFEPALGGPRFAQGDWTLQEGRHEALQTLAGRSGSAALVGSRAVE